MSTWLERLVELVPVPPGFGGLEYDWTPTEEALGKEVPSTFKQLVRAYGDVFFADGYFSPYHPHPIAGRDLLESTREFRKFLDIYEFPRPPEVPPAGVRIESAELIKWGGGTGQNYLWHTGDTDPEKWTIILTDGAQQNWSFHDMPVAEFLFRWLTKDLVPPELHPYWERDVIFWGETPSCEFFTFDSGNEVVATKEIVLEVLADSVVLPWELRWRTQEEIDADSRPNWLSDNIPGEPSTMWPPPPGSPPPSVLPFPPRDLGKPVLDLVDYPDGYEPELLTEVPATGMPSLDAFVQKFPPIAGRKPFDWAETEQALGRALPAEFTRFVDLYGDVVFGGLFRPFHPSRYPWVDVVTNTAKFHESLARFPVGEWPADTAVAQLDLTAKNTIAWGGADNGDLHLWHLTGERPEEWTILLVGADFHDWYSFTGSVPELIYRWMFDDLPDLPEYWNKDTRLHGGPMLSEFGPYHPNGTPLAVFDQTRKE